MSDETWETRARAELRCVALDIREARAWRDRPPGGQQAGIPCNVWINAPPSALHAVDAMLRRLGIEAEP